jgi:hypothetical protein
MPSRYHANSQHPHADRRSGISRSRHLLLVGLALALSLVVLYTKDILIGDARWWNLTMAALLIAVLVRYVRAQHDEP